MIPRSFLADASGDVDLNQGLRFTPDLQTYVIQRLRQNLSFFLGEWFLDLRQGLPWFRILGQPYDPALVSSILRKAALQTPGVARVLRLTLSFDRRTRTLSVPQFACILKDGSQITQDDLGRPFMPVPETVK